MGSRDDLPEPAGPGPDSLLDGGTPRAAAEYAPPKPARILIVAGTAALFGNVVARLEVGRNDRRVVWIGPHNYLKKTMGLERPFVLDVDAGMEMFPPDFYPTLRSRDPRRLSVEDARRWLHGR